MDSYKLAVKLFVAEGSKPPVDAFVPVFHRWIQTRALPEHQLIDVADYKHVPEGPGVVLVSHEANVHADLGEGHLGLLYVRKQPIDGADSFARRLRAVLRYVLQAATLLEDDQSLRGRIRFRTDELLFRVYDRLNAPNTSTTFDAMKDDLNSCLHRLFGEAPARLTHRTHPESLFEVVIGAPQAPPIGTLLERAVIE